MFQENKKNNVPSEKRLFTCNFQTTLISNFFGGDGGNLTPGEIRNEQNRSCDKLQAISTHLTVLSNHDNLTRTRDSLMDLTPRTVIRP